VFKARYLVEAHVLEGRSVSELAAAHGVHRSWIYKLLARYREGGLQALEPRSRRPRSCPHETPLALVQAIVALRAELQAQGHDAGAQTIAYHLALQRKGVPSPSSIWRILRREGLIVPEPHKRPRCALIRFCVGVVTIALAAASLLTDALILPLLAACCSFYLFGRVFPIGLHRYSALGVGLWLASGATIAMSIGGILAVSGRAGFASRFARPS
jgi:transposase